MKQQPSLNIVLPCYNPISGWAEKVVHSINRIADETNLKELIIVNDGSVHSLDDAIASIRQHSKVPLVYISYKQNQGKGYAIRTGLEKATADIIIYTDIDFPYTHESLMDVYHALEQGENDLAVGIKEPGYYDKVPPARKYISKILRKMIALILDLKITDTQCGLKGMLQHTKSVWLQGTINRYLFDLEAIYTAGKRKMRVKAIPVKLREGVVFSKIPMKILLKEFRNFLSIAFRK